MDGRGPRFNGLNVPNKGRCAWPLITWVSDGCPSEPSPENGSAFNLLLLLLCWVTAGFPPVKQPGE